MCKFATTWSWERREGRARSSRLSIQHHACVNLTQRQSRAVLLASPKSHFRADPNFPLSLEQREHYTRPQGGPRAHHRAPHRRRRLLQLLPNCPGLEICEPHTLLIFSTTIGIPHHSDSPGFVLVCHVHRLRRSRRVKSTRRENASSKRQKCYLMLDMRSSRGGRGRRTRLSLNARVG
jgi:hypothetical protein